MSKYQLFISDVDGCISEPFVQPDWDILTEIRHLNMMSRVQDDIPPMTLCTGRPQPYAEALAQWLGIEHWFIFESGAGMYHPKTNEVRWSERIPEEIFEALNEMRAFAEKEIIKIYPKMMIEFTKRVDVGLVSPDTKAIQDAYNRCAEKAAEIHPDLEVHNTDISVNIIYSKVNKGTGVGELAEIYDYDLDRLAYIGDGMNDAAAMTRVGKSFAPANARPQASEVADVNLPDKETAAVLKAYKMLIG
jgi:HAD superfamily hydrolase (TIGR01484 family)